MSEANNIHQPKRLFSIVLAVISIIIVFFIALGILINYIQNKNIEVNRAEQSSLQYNNQQNEQTRQHNLDQCYQEADNEYNVAWANQCAADYQTCRNDANGVFSRAHVNCELNNPKNTNGCTITSAQATALNNTKTNSKRECLQRYSN